MGEAASCRHGQGRPRKLLYAALAAYLLVLGFLSLNPWSRPPSRPGIFSPDKIAHGIAYGGLAIAFYCFLARSRIGKGPWRTGAWGMAIGASALVGALLEIAQGLLTSTRSGSLGDAVANLVGAVVGSAVFLAVQRLRGRAQ